MRFSVIAIIKLSLLTSLGGQSITIGGVATDTIYLGVVNEVALNLPDCENIDYIINPSIIIERDSCLLSIFPTQKCTTYQLIIKYNNSSLDTFQLYADIVTLDIGITTIQGFIPHQTLITSGLAMQIRGLMPLINCPWLRDACHVTGYLIVLEKKGEVLYSEQNHADYLSTKAIAAIRDAQSGTTIHFEDIKVKCPGDGHPPLQNPAYLTPWFRWQQFIFLR